MHYDMFVILNIIYYMPEMALDFNAYSVIIVCAVYKLFISLSERSFKEATPL